MDRTTKKLIGREYKKGVTMAGVLKASPKKLFDLYTKAITVIETNLDMGDLDAAKFVVNHKDGTPTQKIKMDAKVETTQTAFDVTRLTDKERDAMRELIRKTKG